EFSGSETRCSRSAVERPCSGFGAGTPTSRYVRRRASSRACCRDGVTNQLKSQFAGKRALVTGGLGFIGSNVARRLVESGANVTIVDNLEPKYGGNRFNINGLESKLAVTIADVRDGAAMKSLLTDKDYVFNLAGQ